MYPNILFTYADYALNHMKLHCFSTIFSDVHYTPVWYHMISSLVIFLVICEILSENANFKDDLIIYYYH